ncbi:MAG: Ni/Fe-hydrogenase, b-type cytochrome subunit [Flavobacteriaceae bacterium]|jgi:Ni/Fe-hydrogenase 1 B-type cytochrome subunit|nr:Ni/Fe-hydrogenase, b-type cytochrome subunit [Flavobacteriaceae bacterium]
MDTTTQIERIPVKTTLFRRAYIWQLPVRFFHWINALAITLLVITGLIIASPPAILTAGEASNLFLMGYVREIHFISAYAMVAVMVMRVYWAFAGNHFANWRQFLPFTKKGRAKIWHVLKYDIFLMNEKNPQSQKIPTGHNSLAAVSYLVMFVLGIIMIFTGFAMYAPTSTWFFPKMFTWVTGVFGGDELQVRMLHHVSMWLFILFIIVHIYLVLFHDWLEGRGETSAMISGYKFCREEQFDEDEENKESK